MTVDYRAGVPLAVTLTESTEELEEVQVIAYGTQRKDLTVTSIATVKADGLKDNTYSNPIDKIQGAVAGVDIIKPTERRVHPGISVSVVKTAFPSNRGGWAATRCM